MEKSEVVKISGSIGDRDGDPEVDPHQSTVIQDLPKEMMAPIFSYLTHTEKLISRLVFKNWNGQISSVLSKSSVFELGSIDSQEVFLNSYTEWTKLRISDYGSSALPKEYKSLITTLQLDFSGFPDKLMNWMELCIGFPNVTDLGLNLDDREIECGGSHSLAQRRVIDDKFQEIMVKLEQLSVSFPFQCYTNVEKVLAPFPEGMCLTKLSIKENWSDDAENTDDTPVNDDPENFLSRIHNIIDHCRSTLALLTLEFYSQSIRTGLIPDLVSKLGQMKDLKLQSALLRYVPTEEHNERDFSALQEFLNIQKCSGVLKQISLPWSSNISLCKEFVDSLPKDIETVENFCRNHITDEFPTSFKRLRVLSITTDITARMSAAQCDSIQRVHNNTRGGTWWYPTERYFEKNMSNLTELKIIWVDWREEQPGFFDEDLQIIISNLHKLRILHLESCDITDNGVIGLEDNDSDIQKLVLTKRLYFYGKFVPEENLIGNPLSSLKMLKEIVLIGTRLTDVGLVLGFQFGSQLKQLSIGNCLSVRSQMRLVTWDFAALLQIILVWKALKDGSIVRKFQWSEKTISENNFQ